MKLLRLFIGSVLLLTASNLYSQFDTTFWFATPYVNPGHDANNQFRFVFSTGDEDAIVTISQPAKPSFTPITRTILKNRSEIVILNKSDANADESNNVYNRGFKIKSTAPVYCYYDVNSTGSAVNTEMFPLKGKNALGTDFLIPMQNYLPNLREGSQDSYSSFLILATEDSTEITINPTKDLVGHAAGQPFTVKLLKAGQYYVARSNGMPAAAHPVGSIVTSNKKVAITVSDDSMSLGGCQDIGGDQIVPASVLGTEYIAVQGSLWTNAKSDRVFILSTENNNRVRIAGVQYTLQKGELRSYEFTNDPDVSTSAVYIRSDYPIYVTQVSGFGCEVGYSILPAVDCRGSNTINLTRAFSNFDFFLTLLVKKEYVNGFTYNGGPNVIRATDFKDVPNTNGEWKYTKISLTTAQLPGGGTGTISNSLGLFHLGVIHGGRSGTCRFGYFSDFASYQFNVVNISGDTLCEGQTYHIVPDEIPGSNYYWDGPNGFFSGDRVLLLPNLKASQAGAYTLTGDVTGCVVESHTFNLVVKPVPHANFIPRITCFPQPVEFTSNPTNVDGTETYTWDFGDGSPLSNDKNPVHTFPASNTYRVQLVVTQGCTDTIRKDITIMPIEETYDTVKRCISEFPFTYGKETIQGAGSYKIDFRTVGGCDSVVYLEVISYPVFEESFTDTICMGTSYNKHGFILAEQQKEGRFEFDTTRTTISGCDSLLHLLLTVVDPKVTIEMLVEPFCQEHYTTLNAASKLALIFWNTGDTMPVITVKEPGSYAATAVGYNCSTMDSLVIDACCPPKDYMFPNVITPSTPDGLNDTFTVPENFMPIQSEIYVYNRWGKLVYKFKSEEYPAVFSWDGKVNGKVVQGVYYYTLVMNGYCKYHGSIQVL